MPIGGGGCCCAGVERPEADAEMEEGRLLLLSWLAFPPTAAAARSADACETVACEAAIALPA